MEPLFKPTLGKNFGEQKPSIGRIVHYADPKTGEPRAAIITFVDKDFEHVTLQVFFVGDSGPVFDVPFQEAGAPGTWRWPPRV